MSDKVVREEPGIHKKDRLDWLIDRALTSYGHGEARPGLEQRILAAVAAESRSPKRAQGPAWKELLEGRFARLAIAAALLLAVAAVPARLMMRHRDATVARLPAAGGMEHGLLLKQAISPPPAREVAATRLHSGGVPGLQQLRPIPRARQDRLQAADESMAFAPIEFQPITIAPIRIRALNQARSRDLN
jgi:hypothetical protein